MICVTGSDGGCVRGVGGIVFASRRFKSRKEKTERGSWGVAKHVCVCQSVTANTVPKHDLLHLWQKVTVEVQKLRGKEVGRLRREGGRERERD